MGGPGGIFNSLCKQENALMALATAPWSKSDFLSLGPKFILEYSKICGFSEEQIYSLDHKVSVIKESADFTTSYRGTKDFASYQNQIHSILDKFHSNKLPYGLVGGQFNCCSYSLDHFSSYYKNLGLLHLGDYGHEFKTFSSVKRIVNLTLQKKPPLFKPKNVEIFNCRYLEWMRNSDNGWDTVAYDVVSGLPQYCWLSIDLQLLNAMELFHISKILKTLNDHRVVLVGFSAYNVRVHDRLKDTIVLLLHRLCTTLLKSQGLIIEDIKDWFEGLDDNAEDKLYKYPSALLPKQKSAELSALYYTDRY